MKINRRNYLIVSTTTHMLDSLAILLPRVSYIRAVIYVASLSFSLTWRTSMIEHILNFRYCPLHKMSTLLMRELEVPARLTDYFDIVSSFFMAPYVIGILRKKMYNEFIVWIQRNIRIFI